MSRKLIQTLLMLALFGAAVPASAVAYYAIVPIGPSGPGGSGGGAASPACVFGDGQQVAEGQTALRFLAQVSYFSGACEDAQYQFRCNAGTIELFEKGDQVWFSNQYYVDNSYTACRYATAEEHVAALKTGGVTTTASVGWPPITAYMDYFPDTVSPTLLQAVSLGLSGSTALSPNLLDNPQANTGGCFAETENARYVCAWLP